MCLCICICIHPVYRARVPHRPSRSPGASCSSRAGRPRLASPASRSPLASFSLAPCGTAAGAAAPLRGFAAGGHSALRYGWNAGWRVGIPPHANEESVIIILLFLRSEGRDGGHSPHPNDLGGVTACRHLVDRGACTTATHYGSRKGLVCTDRGGGANAPSHWCMPGVCHP